MTFVARKLDTPVGPLLAVVDTDGTLVELPFLDGAAEEYARTRLRHLGPIALRDDVAEDVARELREYFDGARRMFSLRLAPRGSTFQLRVWQALEAIPFGVTTSYSELARRVGHSRGARAVGRANATNPIPIVVPCHRVIGANGSLTGYGGGMDRKRWLLAHEGALQPALDFAVTVERA